MTKDELKEQLADIEHQRWTDWQKYYFSKCQMKPQGKVGGMDDRYVYMALSDDLYKRWTRQIATPYAELSETEKQSDRDQVDRYWPLIEAYLNANKEQDGSNS